MKVLIVAGLAALLAIQDGSSRRIRDLIANLRSDRIEERTSAVLELEKIGKESIPYLEAALKDADPEVAPRLRTLITSLNLPTAAEAMGKIEQVFLGARTVQINFHEESRTLGKDVDVPQASTGILFFARENKARLSMTPQKGAPTLQVSDGTSIRNRDGKCPQSPQGLTPLLAKTVARVGISFYGPFSPWQCVNFPDEVMPEPTLQPTNVQIQAGDDGTATLAYTLKTEIRHPGLQVRLTFDPKTFLLKKRTLTLQHPQAVITIVEIYDLIQIDLDLPESTFKF